MEQVIYEVFILLVFAPFAMEGAFFGVGFGMERFEDLVPQSLRLYGLFLLF